MKRLALALLIFAVQPLAAHAADRVGKARPEDSRAFDSLLKDMSGDFRPPVVDPALKRRVERAQERQNQRKANVRERGSQDEHGRQNPNSKVLRTPTPQRTR